MDRNKMLEKVDTRRALLGLLFSLDNRLQAAGDAFYEEITFKQFFLLICLYLFGDDRPTIGELAQVMGSSHQNVKAIVDKLEAGGFLTTTVDETDRRKLRVSGTYKRSMLSEKYAEKEGTFLAQFYKEISDSEVNAVLKVLLKLEKNLTEIRQEYKKK